MERIEANHDGIFGDHLRTLAETFVTVGYELQPASERTADDFACDVIVTVAGRFDEEIPARLVTQFIILMAQARTASQWEAA